VAIYGIQKTPCYAAKLLSQHGIFLLYQKNPRGYLAPCKAEIRTEILNTVVGIIIKTVKRKKSGPSNELAFQGVQPTLASIQTNHIVHEACPIHSLLNYEMNRILNRMDFIKAAASTLNSTEEKKGRRIQRWCGAVCKRVHLGCWSLPVLDFDSLWEGVDLTWCQLFFILQTVNSNAISNNMYISTKSMQLMHIYLGVGV
jgi:hypothetical protein